MNSKKSSFAHWRPHPWHGLLPGKNPPQDVNVYVEITPFDLIKYEIDKETGYLRVDRPQRTSSHPPSLYGFVPRTYCGTRVQKLSPRSLRGDGDPLDICVISERMIARNEVLLNARVVGGIQMIDDQEADDKIIAVLANDNVWGEASSINDLPKVLIERLCHYFSTYKLIPGRPNTISIEKVYDADHAFKVIEAAMEDYEDTFEK
ncbi:MAG: inorganic pyrophosphatase [Myxococcales bacterium]|nr:inorganic pyrophosphatase [Myxococcales bacterium]USN51355.1 MAG: inorganic pyrophosphatase [Myxococcales bacterium]